MNQFGFNFHRTNNLNGQFLLGHLSQVVKNVSDNIFCCREKDLTATLVFVLVSSNNVNTKTFLKQKIFLMHMHKSEMCHLFQFAIK